jgi:hypothetical protein
LPVENFSANGQLCLNRLCQRRGQAHNELTHPKDEPPNISEAGVTKALNAIIELLNVMFNAIYRKKLPAHKRGLSSKLSF